MMTETIFERTPNGAAEFESFVDQASDEFPRHSSMIRRMATGDASWREIVEALDEARRDACTNCEGTGSIPSFDEFFPCSCCRPLA